MIDRFMRTKIATALTLLSLAIPVASLAAGTLQVNEGIAGFDSEVTVSGITPSADLALHVLLPAGDDVPLPFTAQTQNTVVTIPGDILQEAGDYRLFAAKGSNRVTSEVTLTIAPDRLDTRSSQMQSDRATLPADGQTTAMVTVLLRDLYGNPLEGRPVQIVGSRLEDEITPLSTITDELGRQRFSVRSTKSGQMVLRAMDVLSSTTLDGRLEIAVEGSAMGGPSTGFSGDLSRYYGMSNPWVMPSYPYPVMYPSYGMNPYAAQLASPATATPVSFEISISPKQPKAKQAFTVSVRAVGSDGKTTPDYIGTATVQAPDDIDAILPGLTEEGQGSIKFLPKNLGQKVMPLSTSFSTPGTHVLVIEDLETDPENPIRGEVEITVTGDPTAPAPTNKIEFTSPMEGATVKGTRVQIEGKGPKLRNLTVTGQGLTSTVEGETDANGNFSISLDLDPTVSTYSIHVEDDSTDPTKKTAGDLSFTRDGKGPDFTFNLSPEKALVNQDVTLSVVSAEPELTVTASVGERTLTLSPDSLSTNTYSVLFQAPKAGEYTVTITATDSGGNSTVKTGDFSVELATLPLVQNLRAVPQVGAMELSWDAVTGADADSYVVYVGTDPNDFSYSLDTGDPKTVARVEGLKSGKTYAFAVTVKSGDRESGKSLTVLAAPLGLTMNLVPQAGSIQVQWQFPDEAIPLSSFTLKYGVSPDALTQVRENLAPKMRTTTLYDLIPGITYYVELTPITTTGQPLVDMVGRDAATPLAVDLLHLSPFEPIAVPVQNTESAPPNSLHEGASILPENGLSNRVLLPSLLISVLGVIALVRRQRNLRKAKSFLQAVRNLENGVSS